MIAAPPRLRLLAVAGRQPWPLCHGGRLRLFHFLRVLAAEGCAVTLAVPAQRGDDDEAMSLPGVTVAPIPLDEASPVATLPPQSLRYARSFFGYRPEVGRWLRASAVPRRFDAVLLSGANRGVYAADVSIPSVWDIVDDPVLHVFRDARPHPHRWLRAARDIVLFALAVRQCARQTAAVVTASSIDARWMRGYIGSTPVATISNGVDADAFSVESRRGTPGTVAFIGSLSFPPNIDAVLWFTRRVWPTLHARDSHRRLLIVGKQPVEAVRTLGKVAGVELAADVPDVRPYLQRAAVVIVPTRKGGGVKNKVLEACAAGRAIVASPTAVGGLSVRNGRELLLARSSAEWIGRVESLLNDPAAAATLAAAGRDWVLREHDWTDCARRLLKLITQAAAHPRAPAPAAESLDAAPPRIAEAPWP